MSRAHWQEIPPLPDRGYIGATRLTTNGRTFVCMGVGEEVRKALARKAKTPPRPKQEETEL